MTIIKSRSVPGAVSKFYRDGSLIASAPRGGGTETIEYVDHDLSSLGQADCGGPMLLQRDMVTSEFVKVKSGRDVNSTAFVSVPVLQGRPALASESVLKGMGTTAIARTTPTNPVFDASTFVGEAVHGGLPALAGVSTWKEKTRLHRGASSEYLNYQFGWVPFANDMRNFAYAVKNSTQILADFKAGSGKNTRVSYAFPENSYTWANTINVLSIRADGVTQEGGRGYNWGTSGSKTWFDGCFTYHIPMGSDTASKMARYNAYANKLLGVRITPEVLWNLTPWSWALDWFGNTGDVLHNLSALGNDGLVLKYGYLMDHNFGTSRTNWLFDSFGGRTVPNVGWTQVVRERKQRLPALPYSLFSTPGTLSATQVAVITALGLNRV